MNISICITTLNEEGSVGQLLDSLLSQSTGFKEIVIVDGGSTDKTIQIIEHYRKKDGRIKLLKEKSNRAAGRNLGIEIAKNEIIALTDAGCIPRKDWLEKLCFPFSNREVDVAAGFYRMKTENAFQKALAPFIGILPSRFDNDYLPSTRSMAIRKEVWEKVGGFDETKEGTAEDTLFNYRLLKNNAKISRVKDAIVEWGIPESLNEAFIKFSDYARGDFKTKIFFFPGKGLMSHNIKVLFVFFRYFIFSFLVFQGMTTPRLFRLPILFLFIYFFYVFRKIFLITKSWQAGLWGIAIQITADFAVMTGFLKGLLLK